MADPDRAVQSLGLLKYQRHIFLCADQTEAECCDTAAGLAAWDYLNNRLKELHLVGLEPQVFLTTRSACFPRDRVVRSST